MCGYIVWTKNAPAGATDKNNPDPAKRNRPVIGLQMITMKAAAAKNRYEGEIYNGEEGKVYTGSIQLVNDMTLRIEGCVLGFLCGGQNWTRAKCDEPRLSGCRSRRRASAWPRRGCAGKSGRASAGADAASDRLSRGGSVKSSEGRSRRYARFAAFSRGGPMRAG